MHRWGLALAACLLYAFPVAAQSGSGDLDAQLETLVATTERLRELSTQEPVERRFPTREDTIAYLTRLYDADMDDETLARNEAFYRALGMIPEDASLRDTFLLLLGSQVGGFYDSAVQTMNVLPMLSDDVGSDLTFSEQIIFVHEYTHALQDQYFGLDLLESEIVASSPDRALAALSLVEGDATTTMNLFSQEQMLQNPGLALSLLAENALAGTLILPPGVPPGLARELIFPYDAGFGFVLTLLQEGGWDAVNAAYDNLPVTSEQILHPEKYADGEVGLEVEPPTFGETLGEGWSLVWEGTLGEFYVRELLRNHLLTASAAQRAAAGWGGDAFEVWQQDETGALTWALNIVWDTPADQEEFEASLIGALDGIFGERGGRFYRVSPFGLISAPAGVLDVIP
jgi:hypothetical protein